MKTWFRDAVNEALREAVDELHEDAHARAGTDHPGPVLALTRFRVAEIGHRPGTRERRAEVVWALDPETARRDYARRRGVLYSRTLVRRAIPH